MSVENFDSDASSNGSSSAVGAGPASRKRKRDDKNYNEIEVDVDAPEPPSKRTLRRAKKGKVDASVSIGQAGDSTKPDEDKPSKRSEHSVWIGNLPWSAGKPELTQFITDNAKISESDITRMHMPTPSKGKMDPSRQKLQPQNKGFAYVDFKTELACRAVMGLSEKLLTGRRLLIKNSKSFEGRPDASEKPEKTGNPASKRIFVGNLAFDITEDDLKKHLSRCGKIVSVFMATFEDSGQCKGYAWITFQEVASAEKAVRGWVEMEEEESGPDDGDGTSVEKRKPKKPRKWWINKLKGRLFRTEFAEDASLRYQKRYGKSKAVEDATTADSAPIPKDEPGEPAQTSSQSTKKLPIATNASMRKTPIKARHKVDARTVAPGAALSKAPRQSAAIVESVGKKVTFD